MSFSKIYSAQTQLLNVIPVSVETDISRGLNSFAIVGLPDKAVEEARDRVSAAIKNSGFDSPKSKNHKVVISLAPADQKKEGPVFDFAIALSYLAASGDAKFDPEGKLFLGELSLDGKLRPIRGILPIARFAKDHGFTELFVPKENAEEAALIGEIKVYGVESLEDAVLHLAGTKKLPHAKRTEIKRGEAKHGVDFSDIKGQERAKRGLVIAAAGDHNAAMYGPPGTGKTMLAKAFAGILPELTFEESLEATGIHSVSGTLDETLLIHPPFRAPHHSASHVAIIGGGAALKPGEITLAHKGVLFMDEFPEFDRRVIESLREPLEEKYISVSRAKGTAKFPADVILVAAMNPCPCGNFGFKGKSCDCTPSSLQKYRRKLSGPIMDRIDIWLEVDRITPGELSDIKEGEKSISLKEKVLAARKRQFERFKKIPGRKISKNSDMSARDIVNFLEIGEGPRKILNTAAERLGFSPRLYHRMLKVARTIADLEGSDDIKTEHVLEAVEYRPKKFDV